MTRLKRPKVDEATEEKGLSRSLVSCQLRLVSIGTEGWAGTLCTTTTDDWNCEGY